MTEIIPEKVELTKLGEEYDTLIQEIAIIQQEIMNMTNELNELETNNNESDNIVWMNFKENTVIGMQLHGNVEKSDEK